MSSEQFSMICVYLLACLGGLCVGSFLNVVLYRLPNGLNMSRPASHCTKCNYTLKWYDNIPVLSYLCLGGKCRKCREPISPRYIAVEILNAIFWLLSVYLFWDKSPVYAAISAVALSCLICIFFIDLEHLLIFNRFVIIIAVLGLVAMFIDRYTRWYDHIIGAVAFGGVFLLIYYGAIWVLKREGLGFGDVKFAAAAGLLLGWQRMLFAMLIASVSASIILLVVRRMRDDEQDTEYPFGPFISVGIAAALLFGAPVINWYLGLIGF